MSLGIAIKGHNIVGNVRQTIATIDFDSSYPTGGEPLSARNLALGVVDNLQVFPKNGYIFEYDYTNSKLKAYHPTRGITPAGTNAAPTFTGSALATHGHNTSVGATAIVAGADNTIIKNAAGDGIEVAGTGASFTVATSLLSAGTPSGTVSAPAFTGTAVGAQAGTEVPNTTDLSALTNVRIVAMGV